MSSRIVRHNGFVVREDDLINYLVARGHETGVAIQIAAKAPTSVGKPLDHAGYSRAVADSNRRDERWAMARS